MKNRSFYNNRTASLTFRVRTQEDSINSRRNKTLINFVDHQEKSQPSTNLPIPIEDSLPIDPQLLTGYKRYNLRNRHDVHPSRSFHLLS